MTPTLSGAYTHTLCVYYTHTHKNTHTHTHTHTHTTQYTHTVHVPQRETHTHTHTHTYTESQRYTQWRLMERHTDTHSRFGKLVPQQHVLINLLKAICQEIFSIKQPGVNRDEAPFHGAGHGGDLAIACLYASQSVNKDYESRLLSLQTHRPVTHLNGWTIQVCSINKKKEGGRGERTHTAVNAFKSQTLFKFLPPYA